MPDFENKVPCIMPSSKTTTVPVKPKFASDALPPKKLTITESPKNSDEPKDFVF